MAAKLIVYPPDEEGWRRVRYDSVAIGVACRPADIRVFLATAGLENAEDVDLTDPDLVEWRGAGPEGVGPLPLKHPGPAPFRRGGLADGPSAARPSTGAVACPDPSGHASSPPVAARWYDMDFRMMMRRYGPTVHLSPAGELDLETRSALDEVQAGLDGVTVVACDMQRLTFMDVTGLHALTAFVRRLDGRGIAFFAYNWQPQPRRLLDLIDALYPPADRNGNRSGPTQLLRRSLRDSAVSHRAAGAARAREAAPRRAAAVRSHS
ncbi:STAS domain-containing protein [Streptomyces sp. ISL-43]|uniref:STAS domain-containing protein n=1 Tax=Streptomyces sp. ISL-43 TaxID=2819183 RepID=UPI001BE72335|nr:STAS domain-containing protein [Streptomyces sp. ISL-43]MBT2446220.1 STAS domain-containing protein [Streptomyces sp. ISL-43]